MSLKTFMLAISVAAVLVAFAASSWRTATRPDTSFEIAIQFAEDYSPQTPNSADIAELMYQLTANRKESDRTAIDSTLANARIQVLPDGDRAVEIVVRGKSWQLEPSNIELLARAAAQLIAREAQTVDVVATVTCEIRSRGQSFVPQRILANFDLPEGKK